MQVLQESYAQATRPSRTRKLTHSVVVGFISRRLRFPVEAITVPLMQSALSTSARWQISYWDAAIIEAARASDCQEVLSEGLNHSQNYGGVIVTNPFLGL